jgi:endoglucanase
VVVDVTFGSDANTREHDYRTFKLGGGPTLGLGPNIHPGLHAAFKLAADRAEVPYGIEAMAAHSGTDAFAIQVAHEGIPTMVVSIPVRNMHTPVEVVALKDIQRTGRLLAEFIAGLEAGFLAKLALDG